MWEQKPWRASAARVMTPIDKLPMRQGQREKDMHAIKLQSTGPEVEVGGK